MENTMRDELIEAAMLAMIERRGVAEADRSDGMLSVFRMDATAAVDALIARLQDPDEEMKEAGREALVVGTRDCVEVTFRAMLEPLAKRS